MQYPVIAGLLLVGIAAPVLAQEPAGQVRAPVVLVWGEYLAAANESEAPGTRNYMQNISRALDSVGLAYEETKDSEVEKGALEGHKFAIFPYNANLTEAEHGAIRRFVADGGKIWASFTGDPVLNELLGVDVGSSQAPKYDGYYASMMFNEQAPTGVPDAVTNGSWYSHQITPLEGTQVIANWGDGDRKDTGMPAISMNENGYYHAHVMLGGDVAGKGQMLLALIGHFFPELWQAATEKAIAGIADVHGFDSWEAVGEALEEAKAEGRDVALAGERFAAATTARAAADELFEQGEYAEALDQANAAKAALRSATYPLARSREGELRAVWMSGGGVEDWEAVMQDLAGAGFNAVFPSLCDAGGAGYESDVLPRSKNYKRDQLAACIEAAREHNIEVHPWRVNWRLSRATDERKTELREADRLTKSRDGAEGEWLCPSDERNFELEVAAMVEMAEKYPVQGIHFDYIRYHNSNFCYCEKCHRNFERDAKVQIANWPGDVLQGGAHHDAFQDWRREQITRVVREAYKRAHAIRPDIVVSAAVFSNWPSSRVSIGQDAAAWAEEGIVDLLMPMTYTDSNERLSNLTKQHVELTRGRAILAEGIGAFSSHSQFTGPDQLVQQIETARGLGADGFCIFHYGAGLKAGFLPALAEGCTGPRTFTPMLRPPATFKINGDAEGDWTFGPNAKQTIEATVEGRGPWPEPVASLDATPILQGLDGRDLRPVGEKQTVAQARSGTWHVELALEPGAYRLAVAGQVKLADGSTLPYVCRSRPVRILTADEQALHEGKLPAPEKAAGKPRVGVLIDGYGGQGMLEALRKVPQIEAEAVSGISGEAARSCQVLVVTQARGGMSVDDTLARALRNWIAAGGAVLATHDAVGYRGHVPIAPEVCQGGVGHDRTTSVMVADSPLVPAEYRGAVFDHAFFDHIILRAGDNGQTVVTDEAGKPVVVVGQVDKGRYAASGIAFGLNAETREEEPADGEADLLQELILWLASVN